MYPSNLIHLSAAQHMLPHEEAERIAAQLCKDDQEWSYFAVPANGTHSRIEIFDEEGESVGFL